MTSTDQDKSRIGEDTPPPTPAADAKRPAKPLPPADTAPPQPKAAAPKAAAPKAARAPAIGVTIIIAAIVGLSLWYSSSRSR